MERYMLFSFDTYYPSGGMSDFIGSYDTIEAAYANAMRGYTDNYHIYDTVANKIVRTNWDDEELKINLVSREIGHESNR